MADELEIMMGIYAFCAQIDADRGKKSPLNVQQSTNKQTEGKPKKEDNGGQAKKQQDVAPAKKEPPAKKVLEPPSAELLAKHARLVAVGEECLEKEELLALMQARVDGFRL
jgi:hypothetical protein